ncbi:MAG: Holliday junction resolvase RuvX [Phycisphaerae bacterium]|jgi:putative Holliday junction resolvase|nr:Holliday junction resolvase RuvX [Phycisphaerae bacterium]
MRYMAIDLGERRTGIATGDAITGLVQPRVVIEQSKGEELLRKLLVEINDFGPNRLVVGLPFNMDGTEGPAAKSVRAFVEQLASRAQVPIDYQDERLTSFAAEKHLDRSGRTRKEKKELRDALAAAEILRDYLRRISGQDQVPDGEPDDVDPDDVGRENGRGC